jgi:hypothetical protein
MSKIEYPLEPIFYILSGSGPVIHYGCVTSNQVMESAIQNMQTFTDKAEWIEALNSLGIDNESIEKQ